MLGRLIKACAGVVFSEEHEIPAWMGALLDGTTDANGLLIKGAGHKYLRRVPKAGGGYRYFYNVTGGQGIGHAGEMVAGAAFRVKHAGKEGHFHVTADHGEEVTVRHDESGHEQKMSKAALRAMLHAEHAEALGAVKVRASKVLEQAKKTGTKKQQEKAAALVSKYGGASSAPSDKLRISLPAEYKPREGSRDELQRHQEALRVDLPGKMPRSEIRKRLGDLLARAGVDFNTYDMEDSRPFDPHPNFDNERTHVFDLYHKNTTGRRVSHNSALTVHVREGDGGKEVDRLTPAGRSTPLYDRFEGTSYDLDGTPQENLKKQPVNLNFPAGLSAKQKKGLYGRQAQWWLRDDISGDFVPIPKEEGDNPIALNMELYPGEYTLGTGDRTGPRHSFKVGS